MTMTKHAILFALLSVLTMIGIKGLCNALSNTHDARTATPTSNELYRVPQSEVSYLVTTPRCDEPSSYDAIPWILPQCYRMIEERDEAIIHEFLGESFGNWFNYNPSTDDEDTELGMLFYPVDPVFTINNVIDGELYILVDHLSMLDDLMKYYDEY